jgi:hypothetical protein
LKLSGEQNKYYAKWNLHFVSWRLTDNGWQAGAAAYENPPTVKDTIFFRVLKCTKQARHYFPPKAPY